MNGGLYNKNVLFASRTVGSASALDLDVLHCELEHCENDKGCMMRKKEKKSWPATLLLVSGVNLFDVGKNLQLTKKKKKKFHHMISHQFILYYIIHKLRMHQNSSVQSENLDVVNDPASDY